MIKYVKEKTPFLKNELSTVGSQIAKNFLIHLLFNKNLLSPQFMSGTTDEVAKMRLLFSCFLLFLILNLYKAFLFFTQVLTFNSSCV